jgi:hypothetical protein
VESEKCIENYPYNFKGRKRFGAYAWIEEYAGDGR